MVFLKPKKPCRWWRSLAFVTTVALVMGQSHRDLGSELVGRGEFAGITRFLSYAVRDEPPSFDEINGVHSQEELRLLVEKWLGTPEFSKRVVRHFTDMLGVDETNFFVNTHLILKENADGILTLDDKKNCEEGGAKRVDAWWTTGGSQVLVCQDALSDALRYPLGQGGFAVCTLRGGSTGMGDPRCGCGPKLIGCFPKKLLPSLQREMVYEVGQRALRVVEENGSWMDFLGGQDFWGTRLLYWRYLLAQIIFTRGGLPSPLEMDTLESLSVTDKQKAAFPSGVLARGGILSSPSFLIQYPNFRSRTRALVEAFLCRKIDGTLNTHEISSYLNKDFTTIDGKNATRPDCAVCHYGLDNMATMLLGFSGTGSIDPESKISQVGMAFGSKDQGAQGLARALVERSPWFHKCMAQKAWEGFTGESFKDLPQEDKSVLIDASAGGPRNLLMTLFNKMVFGLRPGRQVSVFVSKDQGMGTAPVSQPVGKSSSKTTGDSEDAEISFSAVDPIIKTYCAGSSCHSQGSPFAVFVGQEGRVSMYGGVIRERLLLKGGGRMPPGTRQLQGSEMELLLKYLDQVD